MTQPHTTVLLEETVAALALRNGDIAVDCTVGGGGHTSGLLAAVGEAGQVWGIDRDQTALALAGERLNAAVKSGHLHLRQGRFSEIGQVLSELNGKISGICADIGVSSMHLDQAERGFSFQADGPLDMRMDQSQGHTAAELLATASEAELTKIFRDYGEEPKAKFVARRIVNDRVAKPIVSTAQLAELVKDSIHYPGPSRKHPATRIFQALRIAVNDELGELERMLDQAFQALRPGGRLAIISFHSLEDRIVKETFIKLTGRRNRENLPRDLPVIETEVQRLQGAKAEIIKPFPHVPSERECQANPRSRSAKLRVLAKL